MATITIRFYLLLSHWLGTNCLSLKASNLEEVMTKLEGMFGARLQEQLQAHKIGTDVKLRDFCLLLLNGRSIYTQDLTQIKLKEGDILQVFPPAAGG